MEADGSKRDHYAGRLRPGVRVALVNAPQAASRFTGFSCENDSCPNALAWSGSGQTTSSPLPL